MPEPMPKNPSRSKKKLSPLEKEIAELRAQLPGQQDWRSSDAQELTRRRLRALESPPAIRNLEPGRRIHSRFQVTSLESGGSYLVEIIDLSEGLFFSTSPDFANAGLGTCKHTESVLIHLRKRFPNLYTKAAQAGAQHATLIVRDDDLELHGVEAANIPRKLRLCVGADGRRKATCAPEKLIATATACHADGVRVSAAVPGWLQRHEREIERHLLRRDYERRVQAGDFPQHETLVPLFPYQRAGMLHLAFTERAMIADEMGLGKTIQGIAAAALLHRLGKAERCLIVSPASLKAEWQEQIEKFTALPCEVIYGNRRQRATAYAEPAAFFTIVNYEQVRSDSLDINEYLHPDIVILDEAQRIKNWASQTAQAIKRLRSRYAFVLTGTPIENRIDELYSIVEFLDPSIFGALFRFNREFYELDEHGKPAGYRNLDQLRERIAPILLRRRKADVEDELPDRSDENRFVQLTEGQRSDYASIQEAVRKLIQMSKKRPLTREQHMSLMGKLGMMRMLCDTQYILDKETKVSPKLDELKAILDQALDDPATKVVIFSEWVGMLELVRDHLERHKTGYAWHTGSVPQKKRRAEINAFKQDPECRIFLCTESGGVGLNLQNASLVINLDLPWNPAKLEQRIARAWRKGQTRPVHVINLIAEGTIEHGMLETLAHKQGLADGVLDGIGELSEIKLKKGGQSFLSRLEQTLEAGKERCSKKRGASPAIPVDPPAALARGLQGSLGKRLLHCEEHFPSGDLPSKLYIVTDKLDPAAKSELRTQLERCYPAGQATDPGWLAEHVIHIDASSHAAMLQLQRAGLIRTAVRAKRDLLEPAPPGAPAPDPRLKSLVAERGEGLKAAAVLIGAGLHKLATPHQRHALLKTAQIRAIGLREEPPEDLSQIGTGTLPETLQEFLISPDIPSEEQATRFQKALEAATA